MPVLPRILEVIERTRAFYASPRGGLLVRVAMTPDFAKLPPLMPMDAVDWTDDSSCRAFARSRLDLLRAHWATSPEVDDDGFRTFQNLAGTGAIAAAFVRQPTVRHEANTNYLDTPLTRWDDAAAMDGIGFNPENLYCRAQMAMLRYYMEQYDGTFGFIPFTHFDPFDLANQLRGNDIFLDLYEHPAELHALLDRLTGAILALEAYARETFMQGYEIPGCSMQPWCPGGSYLSCDIGDLVSPAVLAEFGRPYSDRITTAWGGGYLHHHELGIHQIATWSSSPQLTVQFLNRDPNTPHLAQPGVITDAIVETTFHTPVGFIAEVNEFMAGAERWAEGKFAVIVRCHAAEQAGAVVKLARRLRPA